MATRTAVEQSLLLAKMIRTFSYYDYDSVRYHDHLQSHGEIGILILNLEGNGRGMERERVINEHGSEYQ